MILRLYPSLTNSAWTYISCSSFGRLDISGNAHQTTCPFAQVDREAPGMSWYTCIAVGSGWVLVNLRPCSCGSISQGSKEMQGTYRGQRKSELIVLHVQRWSTGFLSFLLPSSFVVYFPPLPGLSILQGWCQIRSTCDPSYNVKLDRSPAQDRGARSNQVPLHEHTSWRRIPTTCSSEKTDSIPKADIWWWWWWGGDPISIDQAPIIGGIILSLPISLKLKPLDLPKRKRTVGRSSAMAKYLITHSWFWTNIALSRLLNHGKVR